MAKSRVSFGEVARVVDGGLRAQRPSLLVVLLDPGVLVVDIQGRHHALCDDASAEAPGRPLGDPPLKDELHVVGPPQVQVLADDLLAQDAATDGTVEHLGAGELGLQDGDVIAVARRAIVRRERVRQSMEPLAQQRVDARGVQPVTERLRPRGAGTGQQAVIQSLKGDAFLEQLAFEILMAVQAQLGVVRKVRAELEEEGAKVPIDGIDIVLIDQRGGAGQPGVGPPRLGVPAFLGAADCRFLLCFAEKEHPLLVLELRPVRRRHRVLALPFLEREQRDALRAREPLQRCHERAGHRLHQRRGGERGTPVLPEEVRHARRGLQVRHIHVQIHPVDAFDLQGDLLIQDGRHRLCYAHSGLWLLGALRSQPTATRSIRSRCTALLLFPQPEAAHSLQLVGLRRSLARYSWLYGATTDDENSRGGHFHLRNPAKSTVCDVDRKSVV